MSWLDAGWQVFQAEPAVADWVAAVRGPALASAARGPLRHGSTWFVGVDALENDAEGRVAGGPCLAGAALDAAVAATGVARLHRAQVSVVHPGYPGRDPVESEAAHRFRRDRDAAHLDGLLPQGPERRRHLRDAHAWILGAALTEADAGASPLVAWEGSHRVIRAAFAAAFAGQPAERRGDIDVTGIYQRARAEVFGTCRRIELPLKPGEAVLLHRMTIHGVAPWGQGARAAPHGRAIAYFRPCFEDPSDWLEMP